MFIKVENKQKIKNFNAKLRAFLLLAVLTLFYSLPANAQCAMCRAALGGDSNKLQAEAVNDGIVYLMVIPYILVAGIGYAVYRMRKNKKQN
jgi:hypothetical protein